VYQQNNHNGSLYHDKIITPSDTQRRGCCYVTKINSSEAPCDVCHKYYKRHRGTESAVFNAS